MKTPDLSPLDLVEVHLAAASITSGSARTEAIRAARRVLEKARSELYRLEQRVFGAERQEGR